MRRLATLGIVLAAAALTAAGQLTITTTSVPPALENQIYSATLQASSDPGPLVWSFVSTGPPGFTIVSTPIGQPGTNGTLCYGSQ
jgi:hypothetical protein